MVMQIHEADLPHAANAANFAVYTAKSLSRLCVILTQPDIYTPVL